MMPSSVRHALAGTALAIYVGVTPTALHAQPDFGDDTSRWANDGECDDPRFEGAGAADTLLEEDRGHDAADCRKLFNAGRITLRDDADTRLQRGRLEKGDDTLTSGEYADVYTFTGGVGERAVVDLRSEEFDPYLVVRAPSGEQFDNDDFEGDANRSLLSLALTESGEYRVTVTSYGKGETGRYTLSMDVGRNETLAARTEHNGRLESGDASSKAASSTTATSSQARRVSMSRSTYAPPRSIPI